MRYQTTKVYKGDKIFVFYMFFHLKLSNMINMTTLLLLLLSEHSLAVLCSFKWKIPFPIRTWTIHLCVFRCLFHCFCALLENLSFVNLAHTYPTSVHDPKLKCCWNKNPEHHSIVGIFFFFCYFSIRLQFSFCSLLDFVVISILSFIFKFNAMEMCFYSQINKTISHAWQICMNIKIARGKLTEYKIKAALALFSFDKL